MQNSGVYDETNDIHRFVSECLHCIYMYTNMIFWHNYRDCLHVGFMHLIQEELNTVVHEWKTHRIRPTKDS